MKFNITNKIRKTHNKVRFVGSRYVVVNEQYYNKLNGKLETVSKKTRKWLFRRLAKKRLVSSYRSLAVNLLKNKKEFYMCSDPLKLFFFRFQYPVIKSLDYFNLTDFHIELIRRMARRLFGKRVFIRVLVNAYKTLFRRTNQVRMGGGKGAKIYKKIYPLVPGSSIIEIRGYGSVKSLNYFFSLLSHKIPCSLKLVFFNRI